METLEKKDVRTIHQEHLKDLQNMLEICPKKQKKLVLVDALIRKESWGGKKNTPGNIFRMSQPADFEYYLFARTHPNFREACETKGEKGQKIFEQILQDFLQAAPVEIEGEKLVIEILRLLTRTRIQQVLDRMRDEARYRGMTEGLDKLYPIAGARIFKKAHEFFPEGKEQNWQNFFMGISADTRTKVDMVEKELEYVLRHHPVWTEFLEKVPGIGPWFAGYLIATIGDPRNFSKSGKLSGLAGLRVDNNGFAQKAKSPFWKQQNLSESEIEVLKVKLDAKERSMNALDYDPFLKMMIVEILPSTMMKIKGMMDKKGTASVSPYNALIDAIRTKEQQKALHANPVKCRYCDETDIVNLGMKNRPVGESDDAIEGKQYFAGYCCRKTLNNGGKEHKFFNPAHIQRRVQREFGKKVLFDVYHTALYFAGENPRITGNPRIMHFLSMDKK